MSYQKKCKVFVSYSRHDEALVKPLAALLTGVTNDPVFLDVNSIVPGDNWQEEIEGALLQSTVFVLCWCCQAQKSTFIAEEIAIASADSRRRLIPILLCDIPLPAPLASRQWVDFRKQTQHVCIHHGPLPPPGPENNRVAAFRSAAILQGQSYAGAQLELFPADELDGIVHSIRTYFEKCAATKPVYRTSSDY
jgi:TIR domain